MVTDTAATTLRLAGYADDTIVYLRQPENLAIVLKVIGDSRADSGLLLNKRKTVAIPLHPDGSAKPARGQVINNYSTKPLPLATWHPSGLQT